MIGHTKSGKPVYGVSLSHLTKTQANNGPFHLITADDHATIKQAHSEHHAAHGDYAGWSAQDHQDAEGIYNDAKESAITRARDEGHSNPSQSHEVQQYRGLASTQSRFKDIRDENHRRFPGEELAAMRQHSSDAAVGSKLEREYRMNKSMPSVRRIG